MSVKTTHFVNSWLALTENWIYTWQFWNASEIFRAKIRSSYAVRIQIAEVHALFRITTFSSLRRETEVFRAKTRSENGAEMLGTELGALSRMMMSLFLHS